jgi:adenylate cyclase
MKKLKAILLSPWLALITFGLLLCVKISDPYLVEMTRLKFYDYLMVKEPVKSDQIVIANISEKTLEKYGQYPFPREVHAKIIQDLYSHNAGLVGYTVLFLEPDRFNTDSKLSSTLAQSPVVLSQTLGDCSRNNENTRRTGVAVIGDGEPTAFLPDYPCVLDNITAFQEKAAGVGITSTLPEADGVVRRVPLLSTSKKEYYPGFALEMLRVAAGDPSYQAKINATGVEALRVPQFNTIKTDAYSRVFINWNYKFDQFDLGGDTPDLSGKIVIVGATAAGIANPVASPQGAQYPHTVQANILQTLLNGDSVSIPNWVSLADYLALIVLIILIVGLSRVNYSYVYIIALLAAYTYAPFYIFNKHLMLFDVSFNVIIGLLVYMHVFTVKFITELMQKLQIKKQFGTYLSPAMVEKLQKNPELLALGGESRELSIMFTDVRGFTTISEHYGKNVQGLTQIMNRYMTAMTAKILENQGTLDKYIGDAQMAFWNAPLDDPDHAKNAVRTGLAMLKDLEKFNEEIAKEGVPAFGMGLGINSDTVVVGNMGSSQRFDYTCLGDGVNLASRLEGQSKPYGVKIIIGPKTAEYVKDEFTVVELDLLAVKGKTEPVQIYTVVSEPDSVSQQKHAEFLEKYRSGDWKTARKLATGLLSGWNKELYKYYDAMLERMESEPPENFDGVYRATSK